MNNPHFCEDDRKSLLVILFLPVVYFIYEGFGDEEDSGKRDKDASGCGV